MPIAEQIYEEVQTLPDELARLVRELGSIDAGRFLAMPARQRMESVQRHRMWQQELNQSRFFDDIFGIADEAKHRHGR